MLLMIDLLNSDGLSADAVSLRALEGNIAGSHGKGLVDVLIFKRDLLDHIIADQLSMLKWPAHLDVAGSIRGICTSVPQFRATNGWSFNAAMNKSTPPHLKWRAGFPTSAEALLKFIDHYVFGIQEDSHIRAAVRNRKDVKMSWTPSQ